MLGTTTVLGIEKRYFNRLFFQQTNNNKVNIVADPGCFIFDPDSNNFSSRILLKTRGASLLFFFKIERANYFSV
jgi:hypothetical protein